MKIICSFLISVCCVFLLSCGDENNEAADRDQTLKTDFEKPVKIEAMPRVQLTSMAKKDLNNWEEFMNVKAEIDNFQEMDLQGVINNASTLEKTVDRMSDSIPENYKNRAVMGRIKVLVTKTNILDQEIRNRNYSQKSINRSAEEIYEALMNLEIQLNEIYLKPLKDIQSEMKKAVNDTTEQENAGKEKPRE